MEDLQNEWLAARKEWWAVHQRLVDLELGLLQNVSDGRHRDFTQEWDQQSLEQLEQLEAAERAAREKRDLARHRFMGGRPPQAHSPGDLRL